LSIRFKVIFPYLILTIVVAITGVYVVTRLVASSLSERLTNQLLEAGRVVSDDIARQELSHVDTARIIAFTSGLAEAVQSGDRAAAQNLAQPAAAGLGIENLILVNEQGQEILHLIKKPAGVFFNAPENPDVVRMPIIRSLLASRDPKSTPRRAFGLEPGDNRYYYFTSIPITLNDKLVGIVAVGTSLDTILPYLKSTSLADIIIYGENGQAIATTLGGNSVSSDMLKSLSIPDDMYYQIIQANDNVPGENFSSDGRWYSLARSSVRVSNDRLGVFGVVLPLNFVLQAGAVSRNTYVVLFAVAMIGVVLIGYAISRRIINPIYSLVRTSQAIAGGDLGQRTGIQSKDEIGVLANTFDEMTSTLQDRTAELEKTYHILEQMDRTKVSFIEVSAHELRTPLTLIKGYSQMLQQKASTAPELGVMAEGILQGSDRMEEIVNNMLDVSKIDSKSLKVIPGNVQFGLLMMKVEKTFQAALKDRNQILSCSGLDILPVIKVDPDLMYKVFYHLVINAIKYTPDGGQIAIIGRKVDENPASPEIEIVVSDTGIGIDPQHHEHVFEKFYQTGEVLLHSSGKTKFKGGGPGLGLAIAHGIIEAHHGRIWVESPGHDEINNPGSKFYVRLPLNGSAKS
jgi:signal transduction histidine kinase